MATAARRLRPYDLLIAPDVAWVSEDGTGRRWLHDRYVMLGSESGLVPDRKGGPVIVTARGIEDRQDGVPVRSETLDRLVAHTALADRLTASPWVHSESGRDSCAPLRLLTAADGDWRLVNARLADALPTDWAIYTLATSGDMLAIVRTTTATAVSGKRTQYQSIVGYVMRTKATPGDEQVCKALATAIVADA